MIHLEFLPWEYERPIDEDGPTAPVFVNQLRWELEQVLDLYIARQPTAVLEIGTHEGGTLYHWLNNSKPGAYVVAVDPYHKNQDDYLGWKSTDVDVVPIKGYSQEKDTIEKVREYGAYDWIFIDGSHTFEDVEADWLNYKRMIVSGGVILFHDINSHPECGVDALWKEIQAQGFLTQEVRADPHYQGCGIGIVYFN